MYMEQVSAFTGLETWHHTIIFKVAINSINSILSRSASIASNPGFLLQIFSHSFGEKLAFHSKFSPKQ